MKAFLRERRIPLSGNKEELVKKVSDIVYTDRLPKTGGRTRGYTI